MKLVALIVAALFGMAFLGDYQQRTGVLQQQVDVDRVRLDVDTCDVALRDAWDRNSYPYRNQEATIKWVEPLACGAITQ